MSCLCSDHREKAPGQDQQQPERAAQAGPQRLWETGEQQATKSLIPLMQSKL